MATILLEPEVLGTEAVYEILLHEVKKLLPTRMKRRLRRRSIRERMLATYGKRAFLEPERLKFPIINPETGKVDCRLLYAARIRAKQYHRRSLAKKAEKLYRRKGCDEKIDVHINEVGTFDLNHLLELL